MVTVPNITQLGMTGLSITKVGNVVTFNWTDANAVTHSILLDGTTDAAWILVLAKGIASGAVT